MSLYHRLMRIFETENGEKEGLERNTIVKNVYQTSHDPFQRFRRNQKCVSTVAKRMNTCAEEKSGYLFFLGIRY